MRPLRVIAIAALACATLSFDGTARSAEPWPRRVLVTNDDGIGDAGLVALARGVQRVAEAVVVAPLEDKSGTGTLLTFWRRDSLNVETRTLAPGLSGYAVDAYPADCVVFALTGLMRDNPPDLVISGINRRPNLADFWIVSGTVGAARIAALYGVPAIAVSGLDKRSPEAAAPLIDWLMTFARSEAVRALKPPQYLTVSFPPASAGRIAGVRVARRTEAPDLATLRALHTYRKTRTEALPAPTSAAAATSRDVWEYDFNAATLKTTPDDDTTLHAAGYIVVVPMRVDEHDAELAVSLRSRIESLPAPGSQP